MKESKLNLANKGKYNVELIGGRNSITLEHLPDDGNFDNAWFSLFDEKNTEKNSCRVINYNGKLTYNMQYEAPGCYYLQVMLPQVPGGSLYVSFLRNLPVKIDPDRMVYFAQAPVYEHNVKIFSCLKRDMTTLKKYTIVPTGSNRDIISKAYEITKGCFNDYSKVLAVHDWIAANIYYDWDSYCKGKIDYSKLANGPQVFIRKLAVCAGYSDLAVIMLRALGIPAFSQSCYALGASTLGRWNDQNIKNKSNHAITMVYIQKRWVLMDITWDSPNKYRNGTFQQSGEVSHRYFDPTLQYFSNTHKLCS